jgi:uncharacterized FAD-dependent dehydrogenase
MLSITQLKVSINIKDNDLNKIIAKKLRIKFNEIIGFSILRRSIDARKKDDILFVYNLKVKVKDENIILNKKIKNVELYTEKKAVKDFSNTKFQKGKKIAIIGFGPAGMFSALKLASHGINVTVFERGEEVDKRIESIKRFEETGILNTESNIQFGEGGAGTYSDGKLTNRKKDIRGKWLFEELVKAGAPEEILYVHNPHIGTDKLIDVVKGVRKKIINYGSIIKFNSKVSNIEQSDKGLKLTVNNSIKYFDYVILAIGHSSRDTIEMLYSNKVDIQLKPFAVGLRIEHQQLTINKAQFGPNYNNEMLGAAEYKLTHQTTNKKGVYTFCMCPGGYVVPSSSEEGMLVVNGMSEYKRDNVNANSALLVTVDKNDFKSDHPLAGIEFQRNLERKAYVLGGSNYKAPIQTVDDFIKNKVTDKLGSVIPSYSIGYKFANLRSLFSKKINDAFIESLPKMGNKLKGFNQRDAILTGVESRSSSPVRITRNLDNLESINYPNLYPTGEGAGYAGGIVSAAIDGIRVAEIIMNRLEC